MAKPLFTFDERSMRRISAAVQKVEGPGNQSGDKWYQTKTNAPTLKIGKTNGQWSKGNEVTLEMWRRNKDGDMEKALKKDGTPFTFNAYNLFADVEADKFVACLSGYLLAAECD